MNNMQKMGFYLLKLSVEDSEIEEIGIRLDGTEIIRFSCRKCGIPIEQDIIEFCKDYIHDDFCFESTSIYCSRCSK